VIFRADVAGDSGDTGDDGDRGEATTTADSSSTVLELIVREGKGS
jgi:hypothetical protein